MKFKAPFNTITISLIVIYLFISCTNTSKNHKEEQQPYLIILSMDGFRWDYPEKANTPYLDSIEKHGVRANLIPCFPTKTFPNHYSLATGLYPENHGILLNHFYNYELDLPYSMKDRKAIYNPGFYHGEPIWNTAEKQGFITASYFWVGSETAIHGRHQSYWKKFDHFFPFEYIIDTVVYWLDLPNAKRPHLITFYFHEPDETGHEYGPDSPEIVREIEYLDSLIGVIFNKINKLPIANKINVIILSDHGMSEVSREKTIYFDDYISSEWVKHYYGGSPAYLVKANEGYKDSIYNNLKEAEHCSIYYPDEVPEHLRFNNNINIQDFIVLADSSWTFKWEKKKNNYSKGNHGFDNKNTDMHSIFYAIGPAFKKGHKHKAFQNVNIYSLAAQILEIEPVQTDGKLDEVIEMLEGY